MTARREPDAILAAWLEEGPDVLPESTRRAIEVTIRTTHQSRLPNWLPWRAPTLNGMTRLALAAATVVAVVVAGLYVLRPGVDQPGVGGPGSPVPSASPSPSPSPSPAPSSTPSLLDTSTWVPFESARYDFAISHPDDWTEKPAEHDWTFENDIEAWLSTGVESFLNPEVSVKASAWSVAVAPGTTVESWMDAYCTAQDSGPCTGLQDRAVDVATRDQHPGRLIFGPEQDTMAFFLDGETVYVVAIWRGETDPTVQPYGGARRLLEAFISTLTFPVEPPQGSPGAS